MSDGKRLDLGFDDLAPGPAHKPDHQAARAAGEAEGFTARIAAPASPRQPKAQLNLKVPPEFADAFMIAYREEALRDRAIRSAGEFLEKIFADWQKRHARRP